MPDSLSRCIEKIYPMALQVGITPYDFWEMTFGEICDVIEIRSTQKNENEKTEAYLTWLQGQLYSVALCDPDKYPKLHELFPALFEEIEEEPQWIKMKRQLEAYGKKVRKN